MSVTADYGLWIPPLNFSGTLNNIQLDNIYSITGDRYNEYKHIRDGRSRDVTAMGRQ